MRLPYDEWIDFQYGKAIIRAVRDNAAKKITVDEAAMAIALANGKARRKHGWLKNHPEALQMVTDSDDEE